MTHADIVAWWAVGIAAFAILAHIPLTMLSHHYLPKVEDYLASYSREKLATRIAKLQHRLGQLNDPTWFEETEWKFRENLFAVLYLLGAGLFVQAGALFLATGAVPRNRFWAQHSSLGTWATIAFFLAGVMLAGRNMFKSVNLAPLKRPKLRLALQAQIDTLKVKFAEFDTQPPGGSLVSGLSIEDKKQILVKRVGDAARKVYGQVGLSLNPQQRGNELECVLYVNVPETPKPKYTIVVPLNASPDEMEALALAQIKRADELSGRAAKLETAPPAKGAGE